MYVRQSNGRGDAELLFSGEGRAEPDDWSSDGKHILFSQGAGKYDMWVLPTDGDEAFSLVATDFDEGYGRFSPDGKWIAYLSNESGRYDLYLTRFPSGEGKWQLSNNGSDWLLGWNGAGDELYFLDVDGDVAVVKVKLGDQVVVDLPEKLFRVQSDMAWANMSDGKRFIFGIAGNVGAESPITLILNWEPGAN